MDIERLGLLLPGIAPLGSVPQEDLLPLQPGETEYLSVVQLRLLLGPTYALWVNQGAPAVGPTYTLSRRIPWPFLLRGYQVVVGYATGNSYAQRCEARLTPVGTADEAAFEQGDPVQGMQTDTPWQHTRATVGLMPVVRVINEAGMYLLLKTWGSDAVATTTGGALILLTPLDAVLGEVRW